jgi:hypothetical protein
MRPLGHCGVDVPPERVHPEMLAALMIKLRFGGMDNGVSQTALVNGSQG